MKALPLAIAMTIACTPLFMTPVPAYADDGVIINKNMSRNAKLTVEPETIGESIAHAEHAFIDMMNFYVPSQAASGELTPIEYLDIDENLVEELEVAKPLVSVFIYGPAIGVGDLPFAHSFMDTFGAVSLDDGVTWKATNLSESADQSSFTLGTGGVVGGGSLHPLPADHTIRLTDDGVVGWHANGYETPYTSGCTDCHGETLQGSAHASSCYSCHDTVVWEGESSVTGPTIKEAEWEDGDGGKLKAKGEDAPSKTLVQVINAVTKEVLGEDKSSKSGEWEIEEKRLGTAPCTIAAVADGIEGPSMVPDGTPEDCEGPPPYVHDLTVYPGGVSNVFHATAGNKVLVAWPSRYCSTGKPAYSFAWDGDNDGMSDDLVAKQEGLANFLGIDLNEDLYLTDLFGVAGSQLSQDFADEGYPDAGEVPFRCVWTARGVLVAGDDPRTDAVEEASHMRWFKAERLTSGKRDPNRIEVKGVKGAGFAITWQEDPEGLRPGDGQGPGEGWSGAVAHHKTDVWYSFINWENFDLVEDPTDGYQDPMALMDYLDLYTEKPQAGVPMAVPVRITNNAKCVAPIPTDPTDPNYFSYCNYEVAQDYGLKNFCETTVEVLTSKGDINELCVTEDGIPLVANTASTRPRLGLQGFDSDGDGATDDAWVVFAAEESKGLGAFFFYADTGETCTEGDDPKVVGDYTYLCEEADIGKNQWYYSYHMGDPNSAENLDTFGDNSLVANLVTQGNLLNQPEVDWRTGEFYPTLNTEDMWDFENDFEIYNTEIARRASLLMQSIGKAEASEEGLLVMSTWKQGAMNQGGPADMMLRRIVLPDGYNPQLDNPYAFANMACDDWLVEAGENPYYPGGVCGDPATNLSSVIPDTCIDSADGSDLDCPTVDFSSSTFGIGSLNPILQGKEIEEPVTTKVLTWHQCPSESTVVATELTDAVDCSNDYRTDEYKNLRDQSWYNPLDVSKGHRGFIDGDFVMILYAWSPNWRLNAVGHDRYELYVRRSFDGGLTWSTTPGSFAASDGNSYSGDGTVTCETYRSADSQASGDLVEPHVCYEFPAGGAEHARNITQHKSMRITTLDPRYAPTRASIAEGCVDSEDASMDDTVMSCDDLSEEDSDLRDPSRYFMVFETGDNTTTAVGEAEPMDLFYSRAESFGDDYVVWAETDSDTADASLCYPSDPHDVELSDVLIGSGFCNEFDNMNTGGDTHSSEANMEANPDGSKMYGVWAQWVFDDAGEAEVESDAMARRIWWIDDYISDTESWTLPGTSQTGTPDPVNP